MMRLILGVLLLCSLVLRTAGEDEVSAQAFTPNEFRALYELMVQYKYGRAENCPLVIKYDAEPIEDGQDLLIRHRDMKIGNNGLENCTDVGAQRVTVPDSLSGERLVNFSNSINNNLDKRTVFEGLMRELDGRKWYVSIQDSTRTCGPDNRRWFQRSETFFYFDESETIRLIVVAKVTGGEPKFLSLPLVGNIRYMIAVTSGTTCIYRVQTDVTNVILGTARPSDSPSVSPMPSDSAVPSPSASASVPVPSSTPSASSVAIESPSPSTSASPSMSVSQTSSPIASPSVSSTSSPLVTASSTPSTSTSTTATATPSPSPSSSASAVTTSSPSPSASVSSAPSVSVSSTPSASVSSTPSASMPPTQSASTSSTPSASVSSTTSPTQSSTPSTSMPSMTSPTPRQSSSARPSPTPSSTATSTPTASPTRSATATPTNSPSVTPTTIASTTPTGTPTRSPEASLTPSQSLSPTRTPSPSSTPSSTPSSSPLSTSSQVASSPSSSPSQEAASPSSTPSQEEASSSPSSTPSSSTPELSQTPTPSSSTSPTATASPQTPLAVPTTIASALPTPSSSGTASPGSENALLGSATPSTTASSQIVPLGSATPSASGSASPVFGIDPGNLGSEDRNTSTIDGTSTCFPGNSLVRERTRGMVEIHSLNIGEFVWTGCEYSRVLMFTHRNSEVQALFRKVCTGKGCLIASYGHYIYGENGLRQAGEVRVGDVLGGETVISVEDVVEKGLFNPQTENGDIIVNGFHASCYTQTVETFLAHAALTPIRAFSSLLPGVPEWLGARVERVADAGGIGLLSM